MLAESLTEKQFKNAPDQPHPRAFPLENRTINGRSPGDDFGCGYLVYCYTHARLFGVLFTVKISASATKIKKKQQQKTPFSITAKKKTLSKKILPIREKKAFLQFIDFQTNYKNKDTWQYRFGSVKACYVAWNVAATRSMLGWSPYKPRAGVFAHRNEGTGPRQNKKNQPGQLTLLSQDCVHQLTEHAELVRRTSPSTKPAGKKQSALNQVFKNGCDLKCNLLNRAQYNMYSLYLRPCPH